MLFISQPFLLVTEIPECLSFPQILSSFRGHCWFIPYVEDFWKVLTTSLWRRGMTEPKEKRQGSVGVWRKEKCWEEETK